ncbi:MAG: methyltransferase domain-containing protein [Ktedonobacterales bacterium]|nr:methyltransferase domain-containing protein [Ktedonobacterales bacterium]
MPSETLPHVEDRDGRKALVVGDYVQSIAVEDDHPFDVWDAFIPRHRLPWRVLILGAGGGTIATLLTQRCGPIRIVAIERDPAVARLAREEFGLIHLDNVELIEADAFTWIETCTEAFDLICVDMYVAGEIAHGTLATPFLRQIAALLTPGGIAAFNLFSSKRITEQLHRLARVFNIVERIPIGGNVVVHVMRD